MIQESFSKRVLQVVGAIAKGRVLTYKEVARRSGRPKAFRAVGNILHCNHDPHIPCHRVIRSDGTAGGYNRGKDAKRKRLQQEGVRNLFWKIFFIIFFLSTSFFSFTIAFAAGGGGGGGSKNTPPPSTCTQDTWECTAWSQCSLEDKQTRTCTLQNNCPTAETPKPTETQKCTPECTKDIWTCTDWNACDASGKQTRSCALSKDCSLTNDSRPAEEQNCTPSQKNTTEQKSSCTMDEFDCTAWSECQEGNFQTRECSMSFDCPYVISSLPPTRQRCEYTETCTEDTYECSEWSQCQEDGKQRRECQRTKDCEKVATPVPETAQVCPDLTCGHLATLEERIACRLNLSDAELAQEFQILYLPEYCKWERRKWEGEQAEDEREQKQCIQLYQSFGKCWTLPFGPERRNCGSKAVGISDLEADRDDCLFRTGEDRAACASELYERVENLSIFYLYELEIQAEELLAAGLVNFQDVVDWEVYVEEQKVKFDQAATLPEWKEIVIEVKDRWKVFTSKVTL